MDTPKPSNPFSESSHRLRLLEDRVLGLEHLRAADVAADNVWREQHERSNKGSFNLGNQKFTALEKRIEALELAEANVKMSPWKVVGIILGIVGTLVTFVGTITWQAAQYSTRTETEELIKEGPYARDKPRIDRMLDAYDRDRDKIRDDLNQLRNDQSLMNGKLDTLIRAMSKRGGTR